MGNFSNSIYNKLGGRLSLIKKSTPSTLDISTKFGEMSGKLRNYLDNSISVYDDIILSLTADADLVSDSIIESSSAVRWDQDDFSSTAVEITQETANSICNSFDSALNSLSQFQESKVLHIIDESGRDFTICNPSDADVVEGYEIIKSSTLNPEDLTDAIIYKRKSDGKIFFNNLWRPGNCVSKDYLFQSLTINDDIAVYANHIHGSYSGLTLLEMLRSLARSLGLIVTESDTLIDLLSRIGSSQGDVFVNFIDFHTYCNSITGELSKPVFFGDVVQSLVQSSGINGLCRDALSVLSSSDNSSSQLSAYLDKWTDGKYQGVKEVYQNILHARQEYGPESAIQYISNLFDSTNKISVNEDRTLSLTDNTRYVPQQFVSGIVAAVGELAGQAVSLILACINPIIGLTASLVTGVVSSVFKGLINAGESRASLLNDIQCDNTCVPYGFFQRNFSLSKAEIELFPNNILEALTTNSRAYKFDVPGGLVTLGYIGSSYNSDNIMSELKLVAEFHPSGELDGFLFCRGLLTKALDRSLIIRNIYYGTTGHAVIAYSVGTYTVGPADFATRWYATLKEIANHLDLILDNDFVKESNWDTLRILSNQQNGILAPIDDLTLSMRCSCNIVLFMMWLAFSVGSWTIPTRHNDGDALELSDSYGITTFRPYSFAVVYNGDGEHISTQGSFPEWSSYSDSWYFILRTLVSCDATNRYYIPNALPRLYYPCVFAPSWTNWAQFANNLSLSALSGDELNTNLYKSILKESLWIGIPVEFTGDFYWGIRLPQYDSSTYWRNFAIACAVTAVVTAAAIAATVFVKKKVQSKRLKHAANIEKCWDEVKRNPSPDNIKAYRKAVKKSNLFAGLFGGTKYGYSNYWGQMASDETSTSTDATGTTFSSLLSTYNHESQMTDENANRAISTLSLENMSQDEKLNLIATLIRGY